MKRHLITLICAVKLIGLVALSAMFASTSVLAQEIIVDNRDANTSQNDSWYTSSGPYPYLGNSIYNSSSSGRFTWYPELPARGDYDVYAWWTYHWKRSDNVPYHLDLGSTPTGDFTAQVNVNQQDSDLGGTWNLLGTFYFHTFYPSITVSSENGMSSADAVMFVRAGNSGLPFEEVVVLAGSQHLGDPPSLAFRWETTVELSFSQVRGATSAHIEFVAVNNSSSFVDVNGRTYLLPYSGHFDLNEGQLSSYARSSITIPTGLLREGANTIAFQAGPILNRPGNLYDNFLFGDVVIALGR